MNVNELHRQAWAEYEDLELQLHSRIPKGDKERILRRMRVLEKELDIESRNYNEYDPDYGREVLSAKEFNELTERHG